MSTTTTTAAWITDLEEAKKAARDRNIPILINFSGSDWSPHPASPR